MKRQTTRAVQCTANITVSKSRLRTYGSKVYLKDRDNFEIELFNPHQESVLAKIYINGKSLSDGGIVLRPGSREFLERFLDEDRRLEFSTYEVENSEEAIAAIAKNGDVRVEFYHECTNHVTTTIYTQDWTRFGYHHDTTTAPYLGTFTTNMSDDCCFYSQNLNEDIERGLDGSVQCSANLEETGRVERGEASGQTFEYVNDNFNSFYTEAIDLKILPVSKRPIELAKVCRHCPNGHKVKKGNWKFCPVCGEKLN